MPLVKNAALDDWGMPSVLIVFFGIQNGCRNSLCYSLCMDNLRIFSHLPEAAKARAKRPGISGSTDSNIDDSCECSDPIWGVLSVHVSERGLIKIYVTVSVLPFSEIENASSLQTDQIE